jgi:hypothetical protein
MVEYWVVFRQLLYIFWVESAACRVGRAKCPGSQLYLI